MPSGVCTHRKVVCHHSRSWCSRYPRFPWSCLRACLCLSHRYPGPLGLCQLEGLGLSSQRGSRAPQLDAQGGFWNSRVRSALGVEQQRLQGGRGGAFYVSGLRQSADVVPTAGNIRVLCRLRPAEGIPSSLVSVEPGQGGTITTCHRGRQHRFRLDWVFPPDASQEEVTATFASVLTLP